MIKYLLFVVLINADGTEQMHVVSNTEHNDKLSCFVEKADHKDVQDKIIFFCAKNTDYFNKQQKLY